VRRVAITGLGAICALGNDVSQVWESLKAGRSGIRPITLADTPTLRFHNGAEVVGFLPAQHFPGSPADALDRFAQFAVVAAREAARDAKLDITPINSPRTAVVLGSCVGGQTSQDAAFHNLYAQHRERVHPLTIPRTMSNAGTSHVCMDLGISGPAISISTACSSANHAIGQAFWWIRSGLADVALTGGSEAPFSLGILKAWEAMRVISPDTCRPFCKDRNGMILGEGAGILVLEALELAQRRNARIYAEICGFGMSADAHHLTQPSVEGPARAIRGALTDANASAADVDYINAHGTGTMTNDPVEAAAIRTVFGDHTRKLWVSSTKSMHGHALGAAGALEAVATVLGMCHGLMPPTANFTQLDPGCAELQIVANQSRAAEVKLALSNSFAFGGLNAVIAFRRNSQ
jgi:nodulation protein E